MGVESRRAYTNILVTKQSCSSKNLTCFTFRTTTLNQFLVANSIIIIIVFPFDEVEDETKAYKHKSVASRAEAQRMEHSTSAGQH